ncbi:MAG: PIG-L family deacetylase [Thermoanaerobaculia bacterium]
MRKALFCSTAVLSLLLVLPFRLLAADGASLTPQRTMSAAEVQLALDKLNVVGSALYIAAHPDDENTAMLSWLSSGRLVRTGYLALTRGDGGQNLIGSEKGELLGMLRTQELLDARRIDGAEQFFTRAVDFGYTKSPDETFRFWNHDTILGDVVWTIRKFRPDVIITRFPTTGEGGHGHHTASAILAVEAFKAAGDPARYPEQLAYVQPWQPKRIFWNAWRPDLDHRPAGAPPLIAVDLGAYNPLLGKSYTEIAGEARSMHKSQGFGSAERRGSTVNYLEQLGGDPAKSDPFEGIDTSWTRVPGSARVAALLRDARNRFEPAHPDAVVPLLVEAWNSMQQLPPSPWVEEKKRELAATLRGASGLWLEAIADRPATTPGGTFNLTVTAINRSNQRLAIASVQPPFDGVAVSGTTLATNHPTETKFTIAVPADQPISEPYWMVGWDHSAMYPVPDPRLTGLPENPPITATVLVDFNGTRIPYQIPVLFRSTDRVEGERYQRLGIVPPFTVNFAEPMILFPDSSAKAVHLVARSLTGHAEGSVSLRLPAGWKSDPSSVDLRFEEPGDEHNVVFEVAPTAEPFRGMAGAQVESGGKLYRRSRETIDYPHIPQQLLHPEAAARLVRTDLRKEGSRIGYVMGPGDDVPAALEQSGYDVTLLTDQDLETADLTPFDAVVTGVRAFNTRKVLENQLPRILEYVKNGGTFLVQYDTADRTLPSRIGPWPIELSHDRVTVEEAPVTFVHPDSPLLHRPNEISQRDFEGWVQERGLYFARTWDPKYETLLSSHDPGEKPLEGGLLVGHYGKGTYIYTGYAFFRQLPAGVPGAYRLFLNLIAGGK